jgi:hypothetical protein
MEFTPKYIADLAEHGLQISDLPKDAQVGIKNLTDLLKSVEVTEARGLEVKESTMDKIKAQDKWVHYEILDHVADTDENADDAPLGDDEVSKLKKEAEKAITDKAIADKVELELAAMLASGKTEFHFDEIKGIAPATYSLLFDAYDEEEDNGIETSVHKLIEKDKNTQIFTISKA